MNEIRIPSFQDSAELISLWFTIPTIVLCFLVCAMFLRLAISGFNSSSKAAIQWFAMGISIGFFGSLMDNLFWAVPWASAYLEWEGTQQLMDVGVYFNIPFRQICGISAGYCHIRCGVEYVEGVADRSAIEKLHQKLKWSFVAGFVFVVILFLCKNYHVFLS